ncbi:hypothetical protein CASFOL_018308 [Castilleja foliolosa]|uniref:Replication factor A C-terminal domain-containing protein n=1 Tax=Castilleja foliolosa TaxID=1961234 RepID=A0ABD3D6D6_9LAMI
MLWEKGRQLSCSLWSDYIDDLFPILENANEKPVVIAMLFAKVSRFGDEIILSNTYNVTKVAINGEDDNFINSLKRLKISENGRCNKVMSHSDYEMYEEFLKGRARVRKLAYLNELRDIGLYWVEATIVDILATKDCWYVSCKKCERKRVLNETTKKCIYCDEENLFDVFRYNFKVMVVDESGSATFTMWNKPSVNLIGKCAGEIQETYGDSTGSIPNIIEDALINKKTLFEVRIIYDRSIIEGDHHTVVRIAVDEEIIDMFKEVYINQAISTNDHHHVAVHTRIDAGNFQEENLNIEAENSGEERLEAGSKGDTGVSVTYNLKRKRIMAK